MTYHARTSAAVRGAVLGAAILGAAILGAATACVTVRREPETTTAASTPAPATPAPVAPPAAVTTSAASAVGGAAFSITSLDSEPLPAQVMVTIPPDSGMVRALIVAGVRDSHVAADLAYLSDVIGPRLTGTEGLRRANDWTARKFREYGADSAWEEAWRFGQGWQRGPMVVDLLAPHRQSLYAASWAWAPGTSGPVTGPVTILSATTAAALTRDSAAIRGRWVMVRPPALIHNNDGPPMTHADSLQADSAAHAAAALTDAQRQFRREIPDRLAAAGALGTLQDGSKEFGLLSMSGSPLQLYPLPSIVLPHESYAMLWRLRQARVDVTLRADIANTLTADTLTAYNTVAEIRGADRPDEVVLLGAHLDSWDLGTGTTDNGAGAIAVLEAARILSTALTAARVRPSRTIRFVLFTGEEEGLLGSEAYAKRHADELAKVQAVLVLDNGTGRITGIALQERRELHDAWLSVLGPAASLGPFSIRPSNKGGTDHLSFLSYGVPSFNYDQETRGYGHTHHSQVDTFDHALPDDLAQAATVMAVNAYELAEADELLPRGSVRATP